MEEVKVATQTMKISDYAKVAELSVAQVRNLCRQGLLPSFQSDGGHWWVIINRDSVPREIHEKALQRISYLEAKFKSMKSILENV